jgi:hypothetical protein
MNLKKITEASGFLSNIISLITTNWPITLSLIFSGATVTWDYLSNFAGRPNVQMAAGVFIFTLWTIIGIRWMLREGKPLPVRIEHDLSYSLVLENVNPIYNPKSELPFALHFMLRNVGSAPVRLRLSELTIVLNERILPKSPPPPDIILPRTGTRVIASAGFKRDLFSTATMGKVPGYATFAVVYGTLDSQSEAPEFQRELKVEFDLNLDFAGEDAQLGFFMNIKTDNDRALAKVSHR